MSYWFVILHVTLLTGDDLFMKLVAAVVELVCLPVSQEHFIAAHLHTHNGNHMSETCCLRDGIFVM